MQTPAITRRALFGLGLGISALMITRSGPAQANPVNTTKSGLAIEGYDPVAYFTMSKPVRGNKAISASHNGATYYFTSEDHKALFLANPAKYAPQYGGYCAYGAAQGYKASVEPDQFTVLDGKLYLNYSKRVKGTWLKDTAGYIDKANAYWATQ